MLEIIACLFNQTRFLYYKHWYLLDHQVISFLLYADKLEITLRVKLFWQIILNNFFLHFFFLPIFSSSNMEVTRVKSENLFQLTF